MSDTSTMKALKTSQQLYIDGDIDKAIENTLAVKEKLDAGLFHYNLGSLYLKKGELGPARYHMEKSKKEDFTYPMLWNNLKFINAQREVLDPTKSEVFSEKLIGHYMDIPLLFLTFTLLISLSIIMLGVRFKKLSHKGLITFLLVLSLSPLVLRLALKKSYRFAVVIKTNRVYEGPSKIFQDFGEIHEGSRIIVSRYRDKWYYITSPSSFSGWIEKSALGFY